MIIEFLYSDSSLLSNLINKTKETFIKLRLGHFFIVTPDSPPIQRRPNVCVAQIISQTQLGFQETGGMPYFGVRGNLFGSTGE